MSLARDLFPSNPLEVERSNLSFDLQDLITFIHGSKEAAEETVAFLEKVAADPILRFNPEMLGESRKDRFIMMCQKALRFHELFDINSEIKGIFPPSSCFQDQLATLLHHGMFIPSIINLGSDEQHSKWLPLCRKFEIIGCYAQTELGHGSDVQSLETEAVYDRNTGSFTVNTPSLTATKWWIGDLGVIANHALVQAQLLIDGKKYGIHSFIVPIRDMKTHEPLPGVVVGDIGPKFGFNAKDNGYLRLDKVSIPRENMLCRYSKVSINGEYKRVGNEKIAYATMMGVRAVIIERAAMTLARFLTIGVRYSIIRTQFRGDSGQETKIFDYQLQQDKLIPLISEAYANFFGGKKIRALTKRNSENAKKGDFSLMQDLHALLSGCKATYTSACILGGERIRQSLGGHGYSMYSGFPQPLMETSPIMTYEGENTVLLLQTARYLMKNLKKVGENHDVSEFVEYLKNYPDEMAKAKGEGIGGVDFRNEEVLRQVLRFDAVFKIAEARRVLEGAIRKKQSSREAWDRFAGIALVESAIAHINYFTFSSFQETILKISDERVKSVMRNLLRLYAVSQILERPNSLFSSGYLKSAHFKSLRSLKAELLPILRRDALGLVEAFLISDNNLASALGRSDGKAYETLFDWMKNKNKLNEPAKHKELMGMLRAGLQSKL